MSGICVLLAALSVVQLYGFQLEVITGGGLGRFQSNAPRRTVTGTVVNAISGEPIRRALVQLNGMGQASALTGADGRFQFENIPEGPATVFAQKPGFFDSHAMPNARFGGGDATLTVGSGKNDFRVLLYPAARIIGTVVDKENGDPLEGGGISVLTEQIVQGRKQWQQRGGSQVDDEGAFRMDDLLPGRYIVLFTGHSTPPQSYNLPWDVVPPSYYPDAADMPSAQIIDLRPGQEFRADFHLHKIRGVNLKGTLSGMPSGFNGEVYLMSPDSPAGIQAGRTNFDQKTGQFTIEGVPPGRWQLNAQANDNQGHMYLAKQEVAVSHDDLSNLQLTLSAGASIPISITHVGQPEQVSQSEPQQPSNANLIAVLISQDSPNLFQQYQSQTSGEQAQPQINNVPPGKFRLQLLNTQSECAESAWYGSTDLLNDYLVIGEGGGVTQPITVTLQSNCATLTVHVHAKEREQHGVILIVPNSPVQEPIESYWMPQMQPSSQLSPGSYRVYAFSTIAGLEYANPDVVRAYSSHSVTLAPNQKLELDVELTERSSNGN